MIESKFPKDLLGLGFYRHSIFKMLLDLNNPGEISLSPGHSWKHKTSTVPSNRAKSTDQRKIEKKDNQNHLQRPVDRKRTIQSTGHQARKRAWPREAARRATTQLFPPLPPLSVLCPFADSALVCFSRLPALCRFKQILCYSLIRFWLFTLQNAF